MQPTVQNTSVFAKPDFPRKIWQTAKTGVAGMDEADRQAVQSWTKMNQKWRYETITQYGAESYIQERFADRWEIQEVFTDLQDPILRSDLIRYLVLLGDGGVYSDLDTRSLKPIDGWIPIEYKNRANVVIGVEYDKLDGGRWTDWTLDLQFCSWTVLARPGHPLLELTVARAIQGLKSHALKQETTISGITLSREEVLDTTGPAMFTRAVFESLSTSTGTNFTLFNVTGMQSPKLVDDILILPIAAFGNGQGHSNAPSPDHEGALVQHLFKGSWKDKHPLEGQSPEAASPESHTEGGKDKANEFDTKGAV